jgi:hypothetical protein
MGMGGNYEQDWYEIYYEGNIYDRLEECQNSDRS